MKLFGKEVLLRETGCSLLGMYPSLVAPMVNLYVKVTSRCNASCRFCCNTEHSSRNVFDIQKLFHVIDEVHAKGVKLNRVSITGGEPSMLMDIVWQILNKMNERSYMHIPIQLNTNGLSDDAHILMRNPRWDFISLSIHHYDTSVMAEIYGLKNTPVTVCLDAIDRQVLSCSCNLIKGYIDCAEEAQKMMDYVISLGVRTMGFVSLMPSNQYCKEHFVSYDDVDFLSINGIMKTKGRTNGTHCRCENYLYRNDKGALDVYIRQNMEPSYCASSLVYDGAYLRQGFHENNIIY